MSGHKKHLSIKSWSEEDQPREKLLSKGKKSLTNAELMAILVRIGSAGESALSLCQRIMKDHNNDIANLGRLEVSDLVKYKGVGEAKAITIVAALELGRRRQSENSEKKPKIQSSKDAAHYISHRLRDIPHEEFWIILLNRAARVIGEAKISSGGVKATVVDTKIIFKKCVEALAESVILVHNHPSGNKSPSPQDKLLTTQIVNGGKLIDIKIVDHLIITDNDYFSFADEGLI